MQIKSICDWVTSVTAAISHIFYTKVLTNALNTIIPNSQSRRSNSEIVKFGTAHLPVIIFHWTRIKLYGQKANKRAEITPNFQAKRLMLKVPAARALAVRTCRLRLWAQRPRLIFQHLMGITIELGAKVRKAPGFP